MEQNMTNNGKKEKGGIVGIIVGIDGYEDRKAKPLHCAVNDAVSLRETLLKAFIHCKSTAYMLYFLRW
ncbi:MAG: hypothetical protein MUF15_26435 [Acidobacteria bacterium]|jgi:hypothetical protein|nr:hypothetical protein [Acidobacteriota bacterium]